MSPGWRHDPADPGRYPARVVTHRYVELMNGRYDRIRGSVWGEACLGISYDGDEWSATIEARPRPARERVVVGRGLTMELALADLERELGLERWTG
jgi:hypothetical protein